jgi:hypothetical protein
MNRPKPSAKPPDQERFNFQMNREPVAPDPDVQRLIRETNNLIRERDWWLRVQILLVAISIGLGIWTLSDKASDWLFGRTTSFRARSIHAPHYTRAEFTSVFIKRITERGFTVERLQITDQNRHNQFDFEITLVDVPSSISDHDVLDQLRQVDESLKDKELPVEK